MSDVKVTREGLPIDNITESTSISDAATAIGESAKILREREGLHPLEAFREAHKRANERMKDSLSPIDQRGVR